MAEMRKRIAELEAERDAALNRAREARETAENYLGHCDAACKQLEVVEAERDNAVRYTELLIQERDNAKSEELEVFRLRIAEVEGERDAAKAGEARAVEALKRIREELETIAAGKEEEVRNDLSSGESHGWGMAYLHVCRIIGNAATQPALDWLAQREREAAVRELNQLGPLGSSNQELFMVPWSEIKQRIAALTTQQPTACPRSEVRGKERFRA